MSPEELRQIGTAVFMAAARVNLTQACTVPVETVFDILNTHCQQASLGIKTMGTVDTFSFTPIEDTHG